MRGCRVLAALVALVAGASALSAQDSITTFRAAWGSGPSDVWVVGTGNGALHWNGRAWEHVPLRAEEPPGLWGVWGSGPQDVFAVGNAGVILHWDGRAWRRMASGTERDLVGVAGRSATEVYAVAQAEEEGQPALLLRYDGRSWTSTPLPVAFRVSGVAVAGSEVLVVGRTSFEVRPDERRLAGVVARYAGGRFTVEGYDGRRVTDPAIGDVSWLSVHAGASERLLVGERESPDSPRPAVLLLASGAKWLELAPPAGATVRYAFVPADGVPVALWPAGMARYAGGRWVSAAMTTQPPNFANPFAGFGYESAPRTAWGISSRDFWAFMEEGIVVHVVGDRAAVELALDCERPDSYANPDVARYCGRLK